MKLTTDQPRSPAEADPPRAIFEACEAYRAAHPPESPEVIAERAANVARLENGGTSGRMRWPRERHANIGGAGQRYQSILVEV